MTDVDVVVIGSGIGGLAAALALARGGRRVLVVEQHYVPGGWCHSFKLDRYRYSPGVHYVGELQPGGRMRRLLSGLGVGPELTFFELNPRGFDHVRVGRSRVDIPRGARELRASLCERFPAERRGIREYLDVCQRLHEELSAPLRASGERGLLSMPRRTPTLLRHGLTKLGPYLRSRIQSPLLRTVLATPCGDHGMAPDRTPLPLHASVVGHYLHGGYYPHRGGAGLVQAFVRGIKRHGGGVQLSTRVRRILLEGGRAAGIELDSGETITAGHVISNADPGLTFGRMLPPEAIGWRMRARLRRMRYSLSAISLFAATDLDLEGMGFDSGNTWYFRRPGLAPMLAPAKDARLVASDRFGELFSTVTTLKDRTTYDGRHHVIEAFHFVPYEAFAQWARTGPEGRSDGYLDLKAHLKAQMLAALEEVMPGLREHVMFAELGTPLTNRYYVAATAGNLYGTEKSLSQIGPFGFTTETPVQGLRQCGASTLGHGVLGAALSGVIAAAGVLGCEPSDLLDERLPAPTVLPADDVREWPDALLRKLHRKRSREGAPADASTAA